MRRYMALTRILGLVAALMLLVVACGDDGAAPDPDDGAAAGDNGDAGDAEDDDEAAGGDGGSLEGVELTVGSKEFTEQRIVGQMAVAALENAGASVTDSTGISGTDTVRAALESGEIDMYWEYTGTGWINILQNDEILEGADAYYEEVRAADEANSIVWLDPSEVNNTYAFFTNPAAVDLDVASISDLAGVANENPDQVTLCAAAEFITRPDGLPGVEETYGFEFSSVEEADLGLAIQAAIDGEQCTVGEIFQTDARIVADELNVLEDDESFFPVYNLALTIREDVYSANAEAFDAIFDPITDLLDNDTMAMLNGQVDLEGGDPATVARDFLSENGLIDG